MKFILKWRERIKNQEFFIFNELTSFRDEFYWFGDDTLKSHYIGISWVSHLHV